MTIPKEIFQDFDKLVRGVAIDLQTQTNAMLKNAELTPEQKDILNQGLRKNNDTLRMLNDLKKQANDFNI